MAEKDDWPDWWGWGYGGGESGRHAVGGGGANTGSVSGGVTGHRGAAGGRTPTSTHLSRGELAAENRRLYLDNMRLWDCLALFRSDPSLTCQGAINAIFTLEDHEYLRRFPDTQQLLDIRFPGGVVYQRDEYDALSENTRLQEENTRLHAVVWVLRDNPALQADSTVAAIFRLSDAQFQRKFHVVGQVTSGLCRTSDIGRASRNNNKTKVKAMRTHLDVGANTSTIHLVKKPLGPRQLSRAKSMSSNRQGSPTKSASGTAVSTSRKRSESAEPLQDFSTNRKPTTPEEMIQTCNRGHRRRQSRKPKHRGIEFGCMQSSTSTAIRDSRSVTDQPTALTSKGHLTSAKRGAKPIKCVSFEEPFPVCHNDAESTSSDTGLNFDDGGENIGSLSFKERLRAILDTPVNLGDGSWNRRGGGGGKVGAKARRRSASLTCARSCDAKLRSGVTERSRSCSVKKTTDSQDALACSNSNGRSSQRAADRDRDGDDDEEEESNCSFHGPCYHLPGMRDGGRPAASFGRSSIPREPSKRHKRNIRLSPVLDPRASLQRLHVSTGEDWLDGEEQAACRSNQNHETLNRNFNKSPDDIPGYPESIVSEVEKKVLARDGVKGKLSGHRESRRFSTSENAVGRGRQSRSYGGPDKLKENLNNAGIDCISQFAESGGLEMTRYSLRGKAESDRDQEGSGSAKQCKKTSQSSCPNKKEDGNWVEEAKRTAIKRGPRSKNGGCNNDLIVNKNRNKAGPLREKTEVAKTVCLQTGSKGRELVSNSNANSKIRNIHFKQHHPEIKYATSKEATNDSNVQDWMRSEEPHLKQELDAYGFIAEPDTLAIDTNTNRRTSFKAGDTTKEVAEVTAENTTKNVESRKAATAETTATVTGGSPNRPGKTEDAVFTDRKRRSFRRSMGASYDDTGGVLDRVRMSCKPDIVPLQMRRRSQRPKSAGVREFNSVRQTNLKRSGEALWPAEAVFVSTPTQDKPSRSASRSASRGVSTPRFWDVEDGQLQGHRQGSSRGIVPQQPCSKSSSMIRPYASHLRSVDLYNGRFSHLPSRPTSLMEQLQLHPEVYLSTEPAPPRASRHKPYPHRSYVTVKHFTDRHHRLMPQSVPIVRRGVSATFSFSREKSPSMALVLDEDFQRWMKGRVPASLLTLYTHDTLATDESEMHSPGGNRWHHSHAVKRNLERWPRPRRPKDSIFEAIERPGGYRPIALHGKLKGCTSMSACVPNEARLQRLEELGGVKYRHALAAMIRRTSPCAVWKPHEKKT